MRLQGRGTLIFSAKNTHSQPRKDIFQEGGNIVCRQNSHQHSPVLFMTELRLLRMQPILLRSTLSTAAAESAAGGGNCSAGCSVATDAFVFAGARADTSLLLVGHLICSSNQEGKYGSERGF